MSSGFGGRRVVIGAVVTTGVLLACGMLAGGLLAQGGKPRSKSTERATLINEAGRALGKIQFDQDGGRGPTKVSVEARGLPPGFHGFHVHAVAKCEAPGFTSAGPHLNPAGAPHAGHAGDMPVLLVGRDGTATAFFTTDRLSLRHLRDADGSAVIVHALPDNYANIPTDRYEPDPDAATLDTGDSGARIACAAVR